MNNIFWLTLFFIFLTTFASTYLGRLVRDRCLKDFQRFNTTLELKDRTTYWGKLKTFSSGLEISYPQPVPDEQGYVRSSAIFLKDRMGNIQALYRFYDELSDADKRLRQQRIELSYYPALHHQLFRALRNFVNTFRDAIGESIGFVVSRFKEQGSSQVVQTQDARITKIGQTVLDTAARQAYEPILELYIGRRVVAQELRGETETSEHAGILRDYTSEWMELLDCTFTQELSFDLAQPERLRLNQSVDFCVRKQHGPTPHLSITIENHGDLPLVVTRLTAEGYTQDVNKWLVPGEAVTVEAIDLPEPLFAAVGYAQIPEVVELRSPARAEHVSGRVLQQTSLPHLLIVIGATRQGDICLPRAHAFIKHGVEPIGEGWLRENWSEFRAWARQYPLQAALHLGWITFNALLVGFVIWALLAWIDGWTLGIVAVAILGAAAIALGWMAQWSAMIRAKSTFARWLRDRLLIVTATALIVAALYIYYL